MRKRSVRKNTFVSNIRGSVSIFFIIILISLGAVLLVGGIFPKSPSGLLDPEEGVIDPSTLPPPTERSNLQLDTFGFKKCKDTPAVDFLVDNSKSMAFGTKMPELKKAMLTFGTNFPDLGVVGIQIYSSPEVRPPLGYREILPISYFADVKTSFPTAVNSMRSTGGTHSKDAMIFAKQKLIEAREKFPDYKINLIFISDGIPETLATNTACPGGVNGPVCSKSPAVAGACRCFAEEQNPESVAAEIKAEGFRIFTIAYTETEDAKFDEKLQTLMRNVATTPDDYYVAPVETQLTKILSDISNKLCK